MKNIYSVSQVNQYIKSLISEDYFLNRIYVRGEVSNCKYHSSGHIYFTLKDHQGAIPCVMFSGSRASGLKFRLQEGQQVIVLGNISVYERDGRYQLYAREIIMEGIGLLFEKFEALKKELKDKGYYDPALKKDIPMYPKRIGIITAKTGAAIQDIVNIATRRNPFVQLYLYPAIVQGEQAVDSIVKGIQYMDAFGVDVLIVGRGGGSLEDLWAFNERKVAEAIFSCHTPVISAVGHETDTTIADFVSDLRAPTPSAAAELAVPEWHSIEQKLLNYKQAVWEHMQNYLEHSREKLSSYEMQLKYLSPQHRIPEQRQYLMHMEERMEHIFRQRLAENRHRLALFSERLRGRSPLIQLERGYAIVNDKAHKTIESVNQVHIGEEIGIRLSDGYIKAKIDEIYEEDGKQDGKE